MRENFRDRCLASGQCSDSSCGGRRMDRREGDRRGEDKCRCLKIPGQRRESERFRGVRAR